MMTELHRINLKVLKQSKLDFDEFKTYLNGNRIFEYINKFDYIFRCDANGVVSIKKDALSGICDFNGLATNTGSRYNIKSGEYSIDGIKLSFESLILFIDSMFNEILYHENVHGHSEDASVIYHKDSGRYLRCFYNYQSYEGYVYDECCWHEVKPHTVERVEYTYISKK